MKHFFLVVLLFVLSVSGTKARTLYPDSLDTCLTQHFHMIDSVITIAKKYIGVPYKYGGKNEKGFDCSGFVHFVFSPFGWSLPYSSRGYELIGEEIDIKEVRKGDFALFKGRNASSTGIGHVALVINVDENGMIYIIHATVHKGITIDEITTQEYYKKRYLSTRRVSPACEKEGQAASDTESQQ